MQIEPLHEEFLVYLSVERNSARLTVEAYQSDARVFLGFLDEHGVAHETDAVTKQLLRQYIVWLRGRGLQPATVARRIHSLRSFWNYLWDCDHVATSPFRSLILPKQSRKLPVYLSEDECRQLLSACAGQRSAFLCVRDHALLTFMVFTGARRSEVLNLTWRDVDLDQGTVRFVAAKGDKTRVLPLATEAAEVLRQWCDVRPACAHRYVFTAVSGARLGRRGLATALRRALGASGLDRPETTPHKLRHTFACLMLRNGAPLNCLQRMLGHTRLDTTGVYLEATAEDLREAMGRHPLSRSDR